MIRNLIRNVLLAAIVATSMLTVAAMPAATANAACKTRFLTFPAWYNGLTQSDCTIAPPETVDDEGTGLARFVFRIVLNLIELALQIVAYASVGFIIYGGFRYLTSTGLPDKVEAARKTILNAVIGLLISFFSVVVVTFIISRIL